MGYLYYFSCIKSLKSGMYVVSTASKSQFRLATFQTLNRHMWLVTSILDSAVLNQASGCPVCTQACVSTKKTPGAHVWGTAAVGMVTWLRDGLITTVGRDVSDEIAFNCNAMCL